MPDSAVRQEIFIAAPPERVFDAWADPDEIARWYVQRQVGNPRRDERIVWHINCEDLCGEGEPLAVKTAELGRRLTLENVGGEPWRGTVVDVELTPEAKGTRITVTQSGFSDAVRDFAPVVASGWACVLAVLKEYVERHAGKPRSVAESRRPTAPDPSAFAYTIATPAAIARWAGQAPTRLLATTPHGAVAAFVGYAGVFTLMGVGDVAVIYTTWGEPKADEAKEKVEDLAHRLARHVGGGA